MREFVARLLEDIAYNLRTHGQVQTRKPVAVDVVDAILDRPIEWVDWNKLPLDERRRWSSDARMVLQNRAFRSLCGAILNDGTVTNGELVKDIITEIARRAPSYEEVERLRYTINGIELIRDRLHEMLVDEQPVASTDDIHAGV